MNDSPELSLLREARDCIVQLVSIREGTHFRVASGAVIDKIAAYISRSKGEQINEAAGDGHAGERVSTGGRCTDEAAGGTPPDPAASPLAPTPETDAILGDLEFIVPGEHNRVAHMAWFARRLERDRDALRAALDAAWMNLYGGEPAADDKARMTRLRSIADAVTCAQTNFSVTNKAYIAADVERAALRARLAAVEHLPPEANELAAAVRDAERYRWLKQRGFAWRECYDKTWLEGEWLYGGQYADEQMDAALTAERKE